MEPKSELSSQGALTLSEGEMKEILGGVGNDIICPEGLVYNPDTQTCDDPLDSEACSSSCKISCVTKQVG